MDLNGCRNEYRYFTQCLVTEKNRLMQKEEELRWTVMGLKSNEKLENVVKIKPSPQTDGVFN